MMRSSSSLFFVVAALALLFVVAVVAEDDDGGFGFVATKPVRLLGRTGPVRAFLSVNGTQLAPTKRAYSLSPNPTSGASGATITVSYSADDLTSTWIGIFASGSSSTSTFKYVTAPSGSVVLSTSGLAAGSYNIYLVISTGYVKASATYTVTGGSSGSTTGGGTTTGSTPSGDPTTWLNAHNAKRSQYGVPALAWSTNLQTSAQNYANTLASGCTFAHSGGNYGENLAMGYGSIQAVLDAWVDSEAQYYNYNTKSCSGGVCGHFTQVLWATTSYVGCGIARCASGSPMYVCQYLRPGNCNGYDFQSTNSPCGPYGP